MCLCVKLRFLRPRPGAAQAREGKEITSTVVGTYSPYEPAAAAAVAPAKVEERVRRNQPEAGERALCACTTHTGRSESETKKDKENAIATLCTRERERGE